MRAPRKLGWTICPGCNGKQGTLLAIEPNSDGIDEVVLRLPHRRRWFQFRAHRETIEEYHSRMQDGRDYDQQSRDVQLIVDLGEADSILSGQGFRWDEEAGFQAQIPHQPDYAKLYSAPGEPIDGMTITCRCGFEGWFMKEQVQKAIQRADDGKRPKGMLLQRPVNDYGSQ